MIQRLKSDSAHVIQLFVVLFIVASHGYAVAQKFTLGVKAGGSLTWPGFGDKEAKDVFNRGFKPGANAALIIGFPLKDNYDVQLEGGASMKGRILTFNNDPTWRNNMTMYMTDAAMMLRRHFNFMLRKDTPARGFIGLGPEINYWLSSHGYLQVTDGVKYKYDVIFGENDDTESHSGRVMSLQNMNRWLFSLNIGAGMIAPLSKTKFITTEIRFSSGHTFLGKADSAFMERLLWGEGMMQDTMKTNLKTVSLSVAYTVDIDMKQKRKGKSTIKKKLKKK